MAMPNDGAAQAAKLSRSAFIVALIVLLAFAGLVWFLVSERGAPETTWTRLAWLFASVEAIAFGAAGAIFGSSIQRQRAEVAESVAKDKTQEAANGRALAAALKADASSAGGLERLGADPKAVSVAARHAELAKELFP